jgi:serine/threonine protein kinase
VTGDPAFCCPKEDRTKLLLDLDAGKRPAIPESVLPFARILIEKCWSRDAARRPNFGEIWTELRKENFKILPGVDSHAPEFAETEKKKVVSVGNERSWKDIADLIMELSERYVDFGRGTLGEDSIELIRDSITSEELSVKTLSGNSEEARNQFLNEVNALDVLRHPCIIEVKGCCPSQAEGFKVVTQYAGTGPLKDILKDRPPRWWNPGRKAITVAGIVLGMEFVHSKGFIHRDLTPANICFDDDHNVKICNFASSMTSDRVSEVDSTVTNPGSLIYRAPEVREGRYDSKVDVYAFGLILYEIVCGNGVFSRCEGEEEMRWCERLQAGERPEIPENVLSFARELIENCWSSVPTKRPSFSEIWRRMKKAGFGIVNGVDIAAVEAFESWVAKKIEEKKKDSDNL